MPSAPHCRAPSSSRLIPMEPWQQAAHVSEHTGAVCTHCCVAFIITWFRSRGASEQCNMRLRAGCAHLTFLLSQNLSRVNAIRQCSGMFLQLWMGPSHIGNVKGGWLTVLLRILNVPGSNLGSETDYPEVYRGVPQCLQANAGTLPQN
jgi:hypothetical protein